MTALFQAADMVGENDGSPLVLAAGERRLCSTGPIGAVGFRTAYTCLTSRSSVGQMRYAIDGCVSNVGRRRNLCLGGVGSCIQQRESV